jgi:hypothetical protein
VPLEVREARTDAEVEAAGRRRMALHTTEWMTRARAMYERAGCHREPEGDAQLPGVRIIATRPSCSA